ncbi:hypothetical protein AB6D77_08105 [Vibrio splendidus]
MRKVDSTFSFVLKLIEVLKPKFYNQITWLIVGSGLSLMSTPLWVSITNTLLEKTFELSITNGSDAAWGFALCCLGLAYHLVNSGLHEMAMSVDNKIKIENRDKHDVELFQHFNDAMAEDYLNNLISWIRTDDSIRLDDYRKISDFVVKASSSSSMFINEELRIKTETFNQTLTSFTNFVDQHFDEYPYGQEVINFKMCLAPQLNCDRAGNWEDSAEYGLLAQRMVDVTEAITHSYNDWRQSIKKALYV